MALYRLRKESGGYLSVEIIGESVEDCVERFVEFARAKCKRSGGKWAEDEIEEVTVSPERYVEEVTTGTWVDGELFFS